MLIRYVTAVVYIPTSLAGDFPLLVCKKGIQGWSIGGQQTDPTPRINSSVCHIIDTGVLFFMLATVKNWVSNPRFQLPTHIITDYEYKAERRVFPKHGCHVQ
jgi:hypothetical protein